MDQSTTRVPLCVDLDGTLVQSDLLVEGIFSYIKKNPWRMFGLIFYLFLGKLRFKHKITNQVHYYFDTLPYNPEVLSFIQEERKKQRPIVLVSANTQKVVQGVANHLELFDEVFFSSEKTNLRSKNKAKLLVDRYGEKGFDYMGNEYADLPIFQHARKAYLVASGNVTKAFFRMYQMTFEKVFQTSTSLAEWLKLLRVHQWVKNVLVFVPFLLNPEAKSVGEVVNVLYTFFFMSILASGTYIINDLMDLSSDRRHRTKKNRPLASGALPIPQAIVMALFLILGGLVGSLWAVPKVFIMIVGYLIVTMAYSFSLKRIFMLDVITLSFLYTTRMIAGSLAIEHTMSEWLFSFSIFFFSSMGFIKRYMEIYYKDNQVQTTSVQVTNPKIPGRSYFIEDSLTIQLMGISLGICSVLVFVLYINSDRVRDTFEINYWLWLIPPILLYWLGRIWILTSRGLVDEDPIVFAIRDKTNYFLLLLTLIFVMLAKHGVNVFFF